MVGIVIVVLALIALTAYVVHRRRNARDEQVRADRSRLGDLTGEQEQVLMEQNLRAEDIFKRLLYQDPLKSIDFLGPDSEAAVKGWLSAQEKGRGKIGA